MSTHKIMPTNLLAIPEEDDIVGYLDDEGEPLEYFTRVNELLKSFVTPLGTLVFEIAAQDGEIFKITMANFKQYPQLDWIEVFD